MARVVNLLCAALLFAASCTGMAYARKLTQNVDVGEDYVEVNLPGMNLADHLPGKNVSSGGGTGSNQPLPMIRSPDKQGGNAVLPSYPDAPDVAIPENLAENLPDIKVPSLKSEIGPLPLVGKGSDPSESAQQETAQSAEVSAQADKLVEVDSDQVSFNSPKVPKMPNVPSNPATHTGANLDTFVNGPGNTTIPLTIPRTPNVTVPEITDSDIPELSVKMPTNVPVVGSVSNLLKKKSVETESVVQEQAEVGAMDDSDSSNGPRKIPFADNIEVDSDYMTVNLAPIVDMIPEVHPPNFSANGTNNFIKNHVKNPGNHSTNETMVDLTIPVTPGIPNITDDSDLPDVQFKFPDLPALDGFKDRINDQTGEGAESVEAQGVECTEAVEGSYSVQAGDGSMNSLEAEGVCGDMATQGRTTSGEDNFGAARWNQEEMGCEKESIMGTLKGSVGAQSVYTGHQTAQGQCVTVRAAKSDLVFKEADCEAQTAGVLCRQGSPSADSAELYQPRTQSVKEEKLQMAWPLFAAAGLIGAAYMSTGYIRKRTRLAQMGGNSNEWQIVATAPIPIVGA